LIHWPTASPQARYGVQRCAAAEALDGAVAIDAKQERPRGDYAEARGHLFLAERF
jgi:hypothetical protein